MPGTLVSNFCFWARERRMRALQTIYQKRRTNNMQMALCQASSVKDRRTMVVCLQNKFEELKIIIKDSKAQVVFLTETKIDSSYSCSQFMLDGCNIFRNDRTECRGGVLAYFSSRLPSKKLKLPRTFTTLEALIIESKFGKHYVVIEGLYRPRKAAGMDYYL